MIGRVRLKPDDAEKERATERRSRAALAWRDFQVGARFLARLPAELRHPWDPSAATAELDRRFRTRESRFLDSMRRLVYGNPLSPYGALLARAGCTMGDLERLAAAEGVEAALSVLLKEGVYLTVDEFKGRRPVVRGGLSLEVGPESLHNSASRSHLAMKSGGSRSPGTPVNFSLDFIRDCALDSGLALRCRGGDRWLKATWEVPGGGALFSLLEFSQFGRSPAKWFSQLDPAREGLHPRYLWSARAFRWGGILAGRNLPGPEYVPLDEARPIAEWMAAALRDGEIPYLLTYASSALRVCRAAERHGLDIRGGRMTVAGEPCTRARMDVIRNLGVDVLPKYAIMETGPVGYGCLAPEASDDIHLLGDLQAVIQPGDAAANVPLAPDAVLFTSLMPTAPIVLLNVSMGDQARIERRSCGCPLETLGWKTHMRSIRSAEKLTCGGMNFIDSDIIRVLDEILPSRFGGGPGDYQLVEEEDRNGEPVLRLLARPGLGPIDENALAETFLRGVGSGEEVRSVMGSAWRQAHIVRVERRDPLSTASGKILHLHVRKPGSAPEPGETPD